MRLATAVLLTALILSQPLAAQATDYQPTQREPREPELVAVFLTMSTCIWSNKPGFDSVFKRLKLQLETDAGTRGERLVVAGVALDWDPAVGLKYLTDRFGRFDEISAGRNWWNSMALDRIWRTATPDPETPQLFLYRRSILAKPDGPTPTADSLVARVIGYQNILDWSAAGGRVAQAPTGPPRAP